MKYLTLIWDSVKIAVGSLISHICQGFHLIPGLSELNLVDFATLSAVKDRLVEALLTLPEETILLSKETPSAFTQTNLAKVAEQDIKRLESFWNFLESHHHLKTIALVGMVNTGKSAIGNLLLNRGESDIFQEACIRETSAAQEAKIDEETVVMDLPGLGSVLCEEDDAIVRNIVNRANLILLILDINYPIPKHLYDFLKSSEVIKNGNLQRIIIIINKIDCLSDLPEKVKKKQIQDYINFLKYGDQKMEFKGIHQLFDYEIPVVPFSVKEARKSLNSELTYQLRKTIKISLKANKNTAISRAEHDLLEVATKYSIVIDSYSEIQEKLQDLEAKITLTIQTVIEEITELLNREITRFSEQCISILKSCSQEMNGYATDSAERFWKGEKFRWKKEKLYRCRDRYQDQIVSDFNSLASNLRSNISIITRSLFNDIQISAPASDAITSALKSSIYEIWDAFDDYWFLDKEKYVFDRSIEESNEYLAQAMSYLSNWIFEFNNNISTILISRVDELSLYKDFLYYKSRAERLKEFCEIFVSINFSKQLFPSN